MDSSMPAAGMRLHTCSLEEVNMGWPAILVLLVSFAGVWIVEWLRHRQSNI
jgi:hypothetical protein